MRGTPEFPYMVVDEDKIRRVVEASSRSGSDPMKMKDLADATGFSPTTVGRYVDLAEVKGYVKSDRYGSVRRVWITDEGKRWLSSTGTSAEARGRGRK